MKKQFFYIGFLAMALIAAALTNEIYIYPYFSNKADVFNNVDTSEYPPDKNVIVEKGNDVASHMLATLLKAKEASLSDKLAVTAEGRGGDSIEKHWATQALIQKYGKEKIIFLETDYAFYNGIAESVMKIADDLDVKGLVITDAAYDTIDAIQSLRAKRSDVFITVIGFWDDYTEIAKKADLVLDLDHIGIGEAIAHQAKAMGAKTLVHYSYPRHMDVNSVEGDHYLYCRMLMKKTCEEIGVQFVYALMPDSRGNAGWTAVDDYLAQDIPDKVVKYGKDTAFFCTDGSSEVIKSAIDEGAIAVHPIYPYWQVYASALGLNPNRDDDFDYRHINSDIGKALAARGLSGRFSNWSVAPYYFLTEVGIEYTVRVLNGEVSKDKVDVDVLKQIMKSFSDTDGNVSAYIDENGTQLQNCMLLREGYWVYQ